MRQLSDKAGTEPLELTAHGVPVAAATGLLVSRFAMVGEVVTLSDLGGGRYRTGLQFRSDQTGSGYLANQIQAGWRLISAERQVYRIDTVVTSNFSSATLELTELTTSGRGVSSALMVYEYDGTLASIPLLPANSTGLAAAFAAIIQTHNAQVTEIVPPATSEPGSQSVATLTELSALTTRTAPLRAVLAGQITLTADLELPAAVDIHGSSGAKITIPAGRKLTIGGRVSAPRNMTLFAGEGTVEIKSKYAHVEWFGARPDGIADFHLTCTNRGTATRNYHPFRKAMVAVGENGTVEFGAGAYYMDDETQAWLDANTAPMKWRRSRFCLRWYETRVDNTYHLSHGTTVVLDPSTVLLPAGNGGEEWGSFEMAVYRDSGWKAGMNDVITFVDNLKFGSRSVTSRVAGKFAGITPGTIFHLNGGAAGGFDQYFGGFYEAERVVGDTLYFTRPIKKDLRTSHSSSGAKTTANFTVPAEGSTVTIPLTLDATGSNKVPGQNDTDGLFSIGNDLYQFVSWAETAPKTGTITARNLAGRGNRAPGTVILSGEKIFRRRCLTLTPSTVKNARLKGNGAKIGCWRNGGRGANSYYCEVNDVEQYWKPMPTDLNSGLIYDQDGGAGWTVRAVKFKSPTGQPGNSQFARSAENGSLIGCVFENCHGDASEFATAITVDGCKFINDFSAFRHLYPVFIVDSTTADFRMIDTEIYAIGADQIILGSGVQVYSNSAGGGARFERLDIQGQDVRSVFAGPYSGLARITDVNIRGDFKTIFVGAAERGPTGRNDNTGRFTYGGKTIVRGMFFQGQLDYFTGKAMTSADIEVEIVWEGYQTAGGDAGARARGTIVRRNEDNSLLDLSGLRLVATLWNWPLLDGGLIGSNLDFKTTGEVTLIFKNTDRGAGPEDFVLTYGKAQSPYAAVAEAAKLEAAAMASAMQAAEITAEELQEHPHLLQEIGIDLSHMTATEEMRRLEIAYELAKEVPLPPGYVEPDEPPLIPNPPAE